MEEKRLSCNIIQDLLPLYCEGLTSEKTNVEIKDHLCKCEKCSKICTEMMKEFSQEGVDVLKSGALTVNPFAKLKRKIRLRGVLLFLAGAIICVMFFLTIFVGVVKYDSNDVDINYSVSLNENESGEKEYSVDFEIASPEGTVMNEWHKRANPTDDKSSLADKVTFYRVLKLPFDDRGKYPNQYSLGYSSTQPFTDEYVVSFEFSDKTITYNLRELAEKEGIQ